MSGAAGGGVALPVVLTPGRAGDVDSPRATIAALAAAACPRGPRSRARATMIAPAQAGKLVPVEMDDVALRISACEPP
jgi:hypothetical protein